MNYIGELGMWTGMEVGVCISLRTEIDECCMVILCVCVCMFVCVFVSLCVCVRVCECVHVHTCVCCVGVLPCQHRCR